MAFNLLLGGIYAGWSSGMVLIALLVAVGLYLSSGALRALALRQGWLQRDGVALSLRLLAGIVAGATVTQLWTAAMLLPALRLGWVSLSGGHADYRPAAMFGYWLNTAIMLALWVAAWTGWRALRRARDSELARLRAEAQQLTLEHDALRARLNPHFVFNALNNLRALINEDPARAREMVTRLSSTLRHALEHNRGEWVTLAEELQVVDDYLAIEAVHYEERLQVQQRIEPAALQARLPAMALQLLVENAIKHGIAVTAGGGALTIHIGLRDEQLHIEVGNPVNARSSTSGHGVGLAYLRAQLGMRSEGMAAGAARGRFTLQPQGGRMQAQLEIWQ
ncbi:histidine kinase [Stenotrophomonas sp. YIM B06876]|uniref:sensor histidine kinase n=1 Tax=Stenotrophomonas sp. YIM B06876 TaxID=3060211 RepID=UPI002739EE36|nr:histidine kinase [Stenotrophomonas sp. YIM B06876]